MIDEQHNQSGRRAIEKEKVKHIIIERAQLERENNSVLAATVWTNIPMAILGAQAIKRKIVPVQELKAISSSAFSLIFLPTKNSRNKKSHVFIYFADANICAVSYFSNGKFPYQMCTKIQGLNRILARHSIWCRRTFSNSCEYCEYCDHYQKFVEHFLGYSQRLDEREYK